MTNMQLVCALCLLGYSADQAAAIVRRDDAARVIREATDPRRGS